LHEPAADTSNHAADPVRVWTVTCEYAATGEGSTYCILFTRAWPSSDDFAVAPSFHTNHQGKRILDQGQLKCSQHELALEKFSKTFGAYYAIGATVYPGLHFDNPAAQLLIGPTLQDKLIAWEAKAGGFEYRSSMHVNFW
jgi:hypothetical protein